MEIIVKCINKVLYINDLPSTWKNSKTVFIPKVTKPEVHVFRPIALNNVSYKIFMAILEKKIEDHMIANENIEEAQQELLRT